MRIIERFPRKNYASDYKFSIIIPSWNNLDLLQLCVKSIQQNSTFKHQIIIHVNDGSDGTLDWVKANEFDYTYSVKNVGICYPLNYSRTLIQTDYMLYMNDDMYALPEWDLKLWEAVQKEEDEYFFISSTMIEPYDTGNACVISGKDYGRSVESFKESELLKDYTSFDKDDWSGSTWPPNIIHKNLWDLVGGYSVEFSPGMYSDPDFSKKLWEAGVRQFKGVGNSLVYHFVSKTTGKVVKNNGSKQFLLKWNMTARTFTDFVLNRGKKYAGMLEEPNSVEYRASLKKSKTKKLLSIFSS